MALKKDYKERDTLLVQEALEGSQKAYADLMGFYWEQVERFLSSKLSGREDVEDLAIATFSKAFDKLDTYNTSFAFSTWLLTIASNTLIDFFRKKEQKTLSIDRDTSDDERPALNIVDRSLDPEGNLIRKQKNKEISRMVHRLKPHYRELIILRYLDELSYAEIAKKLDMPLGSVKAKLFRARDLLMDILKSNENDY
ncbi:MAG: sigma-70 family RNA polymerase sigma factor [Flavobacteriales bacterium]|nr:sigma-70 family RNA polymerase sigma factor [Flavobacteriales bacterium]